MLIFTGEQAHKAGLVDDIGGLQDAIVFAKELAQLPESAEVVYPKPQPGFLKRLVLGEEADSVTDLNNVLPSLSTATAPRWRVLLMSPVE